MKTALLCIALILCACKSPDDGSGFGPWPGMPFGGSQPTEDGKALEFYELPGCSGASHEAGSGEPFAYESVRIGEACVEESGTGYGP